MPQAWNFERRRVVCGKFVVGVSLLVKGKANVETSLEAVRNRMRLPPEDALFAARRLHEEQLVDFEPRGAVRSTASGIARADELVQGATAKTQHFDDVARTLRGGGIPLEMLKIALLGSGGALACGAPESDAGATYRLALSGDDVVVERARADGTFEPRPDVVETL